MATSVSLNGGVTNYSIPATGDSGWGDDVSNYLIAISTNCLNKAGGSFTLTAEVDTGATYGFKTAYYKSQGTNPGSTGVLRLANAESVVWRNAANSADLPLTVNASNVLQFNSISLVDVSTAQTLTNKTLTAPVISTIVNTGTLTLPTATDTLVARAVAETLSNKTLTAVAAITMATGAAIDWAAGVGTVDIGAGLGSNVLRLGGSGGTGTILLRGATTLQGTPQLNADSLVINADALNSGADWMGTLTRPTSGMTNTATWTLPIATDTLVGRASTDTLTNKTLTSPKLNEAVAVTATATQVNYLAAATGTTGTTSASLVFSASPTFTGTPVLATPTATSVTVTGTGGNGFLALKEQASGSHPGTPASGTVNFYAADDKKLYFKDSNGTETQVGAGSGEKNYIGSPSSHAGWGTSGTITISTDTTGTNLPRPNTTATALKLLGASSTTAYAYYRFILDDADANKKLKIQFDMKPGTTAAGDFQVDIYSNTASDYTTGNTRLALSTDSSGASLLPVLTGTYRTTFDAPAVSAKWIELRIKTPASHTRTLYISDVVVGPGVVQQGAATTEWVSYTPTITNLSLNATGKTDPIGRWRRVGDTMEFEVFFLNGSGGAATGSTLTWNLPTGYTIDTTKVSSTGAGNTAFGTATTYGVLAASQYERSLPVVYTTNGVRVAKPATGVTYSGTDIPAGGQVHVYARVPIAEWAGSGTVNVVQNDVEYAASTNGTWDAAAGTANTVYGPAGAAITGSLTAARTKTVRFLTPIQANDQIVLEYYRSGNWIPAENSGAPNVRWPTQAFGAYLDPYSNNTDVDVNFSQYAAAGTTYNSTTGALNWSTGLPGTAWRLKKSKGGQSVGFSEVQPGVSSGLVSASGVKGRTDGNAIASGYVGEKVTASCSATTTTVNADTDVDVTGMSITLTAGIWLIGYNACIDLNRVTTGSAQVAGRLRIQNSTDTSNVADTEAYVQSPILASTDDMAFAVSRCTVVNVTSTKTYKVRVACTQAAATATARVFGTSVSAGFTDPDNSSTLWAVRIA